MGTHQVTGRLGAAAPFDFARSLDFLGEFPPTRGEQAIGERALTKAVMVGGRPIAFRIADVGTVEEPRLDYTLFADAPIDEAAQGAAADRIAFFLSLGDDLRPFYAVGEADPPFAPVVARLYGLHQVKFLTPFENACWAVLTQRNPPPVAGRMKRALIERYGGGVAVAGETHWAFPEADRLAAADPDEILALIGNGKRAEYLRAVAEAFAGVDERWLRTAEWGEVEAWLRGIRGIGAWSAAFVLLRGLGRMERAAPPEARLGEVVGRVYGLAAPATAETIERLAAPYGPARGYWAYYLRVAG